MKIDISNINVITEEYGNTLKDMAKLYNCNVEDIEIREGNSCEYILVKGEYYDSVDSFFESMEYFNFSIEKLEKAMRQKGETMPEINSLEELDEWLNR